MGVFRKYRNSLAHLAVGTRPRLLSDFEYQIQRNMHSQRNQRPRTKAARAVLASLAQPHKTTEMPSAHYKDHHRVFSTTGPKLESRSAVAFTSALLSANRVQRYRTELVHHAG